MNTKSLIPLLYFILLLIPLAEGQNHNQLKEIPLVYSNITEEEGIIKFNGHPLENADPFFKLAVFRDAASGSRNGLVFDFGNEKFSGTIYYGLFPEDLPKYPQLVFFKKYAIIKEGIAEINIAELKGKYDIADWEEKGRGHLGYRIVDQNGRLIYDGRLNFEGKGPFEVGLSITEGPFISKVTPDEVTISFFTNQACSPYVLVDGKEYRAPQQRMNMTGDNRHEITIDGLNPATEYDYKVIFGGYSESYAFKTAPLKGSREPFIFAYTSDSRAGRGGGEREIFGTNAYIMKRMSVLAMKSGASFFQFTGDLINGYSSSVGETELQLVNWKRNLEAFWHYMPFYVGMGNHEALVNVFKDGSGYGIQVDKWPFDTHSAERVFANHFVNPTNGPVSEDNSRYDPRSGQRDFPGYSENVFYYTYGNVAMVVLNSNYWYAPTTWEIDKTGGNPHGYIMDKQLDWLRQTLESLEADGDIDHIFVTIHTPAFPNGGHTGDDMWYGGNNKIRPTIAGKPVEKGIIERRDEFLDLIINESEKTVALLCGDEHNYSRLKLSPKTPIYKDNYSGKKIKLKREFWQITNGSAGAPYYGQEQVPWSDFVEIFSTQYALNLFHIDGKKVTLKSINPDTLEDIEEVVLKE